MRAFETSDSHDDPALRPRRVAMRKEGIYQEAKDMVADLAGWQLIAADDTQLVLTCERKGGLVAGPARITIRVEGPDGIPSTTVHVRSETASGLLARDRAHVIEFMTPFHRRVC